MRYNSIYKLHCEKLASCTPTDQNAYLLSIFNVLLEYSDSRDSEKNLLEQYLVLSNPDTESNAFSRSEEGNEKCPECNEYYDCIEGFNVCHVCGMCTKTLHLSSTLSYKELQEIDYKQRFSYEKESHLTEWLDRFQSRENNDIPVEVLDIVKSELRKERITNYSNLSEDKVKAILKSLKLNEYYDNIITIINRLSNRPAFVLTPEIDVKIKTMFSQIQYPFQLYKPKNRKNFLSYSYFLNKFFLILKLPEFAQYFRLLKSDEKLRQQDEIFIKIVNHMKKIDTSIDWYFPPSF